ncbi:MAG: NADH-quinone oxidoreductase subunit NuoE [Holosporales bacterium]
MKSTLQAVGVAFEFSAENKKKVASIIAQYPEGREASALLPLLDLAQRQNDNWLSRECIEHVATLLDMPVIRVYEVASFYSMFNMQPVGKYFVQVCTTTPCWLRGSDGVLQACRKHIGDQPRQVSGDGLFSYMEVECLGACVNAPMVQINDDFYEDLDEGSMGQILEDLRAGREVKPGTRAPRLNSAPMQEEVPGGANPPPTKKKQKA